MKITQKEEEEEDDDDKEEQSSRKMEWNKICLDVTLVPMGMFLSLLYHCWLWHMVRTRPHRINIGIDGIGRGIWITAMLKDNDKKNILAVQTLRNSIMSSTLMASTSILICCGLLTFTSNIYSHRTYQDAAFDESGSFTLAFKCASLLLAFLSVFVCQMLSIGFFIQVGMLVNVLTMDGCIITEEHVSDLLGKGLFLNTVGNRLFFTAVPLMLWLFGPIPVFVCSAFMIPVFYGIDIVSGGKKALIGMRVANARDNDLLAP